jgi:acetylglutamate kinase
VKLTIIKVGGKVVEEPESLNTLLDDFSAIAGNKILVHGGGRSATKLSERLGIEAKMVDGRRITDAQTLDVVTMVYAGLVNKNIVAQLQKRNLNAIGFTGADLDIITSVKRPVKTIDYGFVGDVKSVQTEVLLSLIEQGAVPVVSPIGHDGNGQLLNTNADTIASELARAFSRECDVTLVYCFEKPGVLLNADDDTTVIPTLDYKLFKQYQEEDIIVEGMIPKLDNGFDALRCGVKSVVITNTDGLRRGGGTTLVL